MHCGSVVGPDPVTRSPSVIINLVTVGWSTKDQSMHPSLPYLAPLALAEYGQMIILNRDMHGWCQCCCTWLELVACNLEYVCLVGSSSHLQCQVSDK